MTSSIDVASGCTRRLNRLSFPDPSSPEPVRALRICAIVRDDSGAISCISVQHRDR